VADDTTQQTSQSSQGSGDQSQSTGGAASGAGSSQTQTSASGQQQTSQQTTQASEPWAAAPPAFAKEFKTAKDYEAHYEKNVAPVLVRDAAEQVRRAALPAKPEDYKIGTTPNFKPPDGIEFKIDEADPLWPQARSWAHKHGLSQDAFNEAVDLVAGSKIADAGTIKAAREAEVGKLGAAGPARVTALNTFFDGIGAPEMKSMLVTAGIVQAAERLVAKFASQGAANFSQAHRDASPQGKVTDEQWDKMSSRERQEYSQRFDQTQFTNGRVT
jgi:hypothetical protein